LAPLKKIALVSIDVEEWFHLDYIKNRSSSFTMLDGLDRFVAFADNENIPATFFTLTDLLPKLTNLFKSAVTSGHEIALHGTSHMRPLEMSLDEFDVDCHKGMKSFQEHLGFVPCGYRASCFSLDRDRMDILKNKFGFSYDASRMDFDAHPLYGSLDMTGFTQLVSGVYVENRNSFVEFELPTVKFFGKNLPISGGGYLRIFPWFVISYLIRRFIKNNSFFSIYIHPFEMSSVKPPIVKELGFLNNFRFKYNIKSVPKKMQKLVKMLKEEGYEFMTYSQAQSYYSSSKNKQ